MINAENIQNNFQTPYYEFKISVPFSSSSVQVTRLIVAGVAQHYDITHDEIEDLKIAVGESFNFFLKNSEDNPNLEFSLLIRAYKNKIEIKKCSSQLIPQKSMGISRKLPKEKYRNYQLKHT